MPVPDVTVIIPAYNSIGYVAKAVESVFGQTLGMDRIELIAVDDGSTDGTGEELERLAARQPNMTVLHEENSGGPGRPRNAGLNLATGRFVFFLDADDYLNSESLERMLNAAEEQGSDVVLGKAEGTGGRRPPRSMFTTTQLSTNVFESRAWWTLSALKLFRRDLIERLGLRFPTELFYEDQPFCGVAYLEARAITILADYNYAFYAWREDGGNATLSQPPLSRLCEVIEVMIPLIAERVEPGPRRDHLLRRHFDREFFELFEHMAQCADADEVAEAFGCCESGRSTTTPSKRYGSCRPRIASRTICFSEASWTRCSTSCDTMSRWTLGGRSLSRAIGRSPATRCFGTARRASPTSASTSPSGSSPATSSPTSPGTRAGSISKAGRTSICWTALRP